MRARVLGLGNTILSDDGVGIVVARRVAERLRELGAEGQVEVREAESAGFELCELLEGCERAVVVDAVELRELAPGELCELELADAARGSLRLSGVHDLDLATALALGERLGRAMPREVRVLGIQAAETRVFSEALTPAVAAAVPAAVEAVLALLAD